QLYSGKSATAVVSAGTAISVAAGATSGPVNFDLVAGGRITGRVADAVTSGALGDVTIQVFNAGGILMTTGFAGGGGDYHTLGGLPTGTYYVRTLNSLGYVDEIYDNIACLSCLVGKPVSVTAGSDTAHIDFGLVQGGRISGTVTDAVTGQPLANTTISVFGKTGEPFGGA